MDSSSWVRLAIFAIVLLSFLRRILKAKTQSSRIPSPRMPSNVPPPAQNNFPSTITPRMAQPRSGRKNDFRDVPPPPENPDLG
jgi:hypothetical protein